MSADATLPRDAAHQFIVLVGLMGAGKTSLGKRLAKMFELPFLDSDAEIEKAAGCTVADIFAQFGEAEFREGERRVIERIFAGPPAVVATGGGAYMDERIRTLIGEKATCVWLRADLDTLVRRTKRRDDRPLLKNGDPHETLARLMEQRYPVYGQADIVVDVDDEPLSDTAERVYKTIVSFTGAQNSIAARTMSEPKTDTLRVSLAERSYDIHVGGGLIARAGALMAPVLQRPRVVIVSDTNVAPLYMAPLVAALTQAGIRSDEIVLPAGEQTKDFAHLQQLLDQLLALRIERRTTLVALGGGVIGDIVGFAAAIALRGIDFIQVPTTLLAQVDSSVGGKTAIDTRHGKNLVGAFHQPRLVLTDIDTLNTLPAREIHAGYAEIAKYGLINDAGFFAKLEAGMGAKLIEGDVDARREAVVASCANKAQVVAGDERETEGGRALLNLGHTFGHALEAECGFGDTLLHGEAVGIGCVMAFELSARLGLCPRSDADRVRRHFAALGLRTDPPKTNGPRWDTDKLLAHMASDKKVEDGAITFILARGIGQAFVAKNITLDDVRNVLDRAIAA